MDYTTSQYSGGGDSGWTMYLEQSYVSGTQNDVGYGSYGFGETEEEDLSMVSDASSGPPCNYYDYNNGDCYYDENGFWISGSSSYESTKNNKEEEKKKKKKNTKKERFTEYSQQFSGLDDTASSTLQALSSETGNDISAHHMLGLRQGLTETNTKGKSTLRKHLRLLQSSVSGKSPPEEKGNGTQRRNRG